jgi:hypothetical protein
MWIHYYASFGPGHQSNDYGYEYFRDDMGYSMDDIEEYLHSKLSDHYSVVLEFWEVNKPPSDYVISEIKDAKERMKNLKKYLKAMREQSCFYDEQKDGADSVLQKNISRTITSDLLRRLHKAGFMYDASDISNWRYGKKCLTEPSRSKILRIMRRTEKYPPIKKRLEKIKHKHKQIEANMKTSKSIN